MRDLSGIKWIKRNTYFWVEDEHEAAVIRGWIKRESGETRVDLRVPICGIYIEAFYHRKKDAIAAVPQLLRALPDDVQAAIGRLSA